MGHDISSNDLICFLSLQRPLGRLIIAVLIDTTILRLHLIGVTVARDHRIAGLFIQIIITVILYSFHYYC